MPEHWLRLGDLTLITYLTGFDKFIYSDMKGGDVHFVGHPYGGLAILPKSSVIHSTLYNGCSINNRVQGVSFECFRKKFVLFNMYLPCLGAKEYLAPKHSKYILNQNKNRRYSKRYLRRKVLAIP